MDYRLGFKSQYVAAVELGDNQPTLVIRRVVIEKVAAIAKGDGEGDGKLRDRLVVYFERTERGWLLNKTNALCLAGLWGNDTEGWVGHAVTIHATRVRLGSGWELGIRVLGSPELTANKVVEIRLPRKKPFPMTLVPTGRGNGNGQHTQAPPPSEPPPAAGDDGLDSNIP